MKAKFLLMFAVCGCLTLSLFAQNDSKTYTFTNGTKPWSDRDQYTLGSIPKNLQSKAELPLQTCSSRAMIVPSGAKSVTFGVSEQDEATLQTAYPTAKKTGEQFNLEMPNGGTMIYKVFTLASPPALVKAPFAAGLIAIKIEK